ncbi:MAG TPA: polysaccharide deacetylase family protein [Stellaceae bacterium]|nr:polysaccharide deacetylase family protein [Stellaceae bacterium]
MSLPPDHLQYPKRRYGMDHERYQWSMLPRRKKIAWPQGKKIALLVVPALEWFPLDMKGKPFKPPGAMMTPYPDLRHYTLRDYGNRVGIFRVMKALDRAGIRASVAVNAAVATRHPNLVKACVDRGWEIVAGGLDMDHLHYEGLAEAEERAQIETTLATLRRVSGQKVRGWLSPARSESDATLDLVAAAGIDYVCDWVNDDMPYAMKAAGRTIHAMPLPNDLDDYTILVQNRQSEDAYARQLCDQFEVLRAEAAIEGGRILALPLHPWVIGQPFRIGALEDALAQVMAGGDVWPATAAEILDAFCKQE